ncbi:MAG: histidinol-phosphate transaminase [Pedosphaera sp.]|nr:histidinol-phosphate transaminase [Pedosphaera sp.]
MAMELPINPALDQLPVYQPGRPLEDVAREFGLPVESLIKLASNENPLGPSPLALEAMRAAIGKTHLYPDGNAFKLKQRLSGHLDCPAECLIFGNGSNEIIELIAHALVQPGDEVVVSEHCFAVYPIVTHLFGGKLVVVPSREFGHDPEAMVRAVTAKTKVVFIANPNNPTGTLAPTAELLRLLERLPKNVLLVMDEAYIEFLDAPLDLLPVIRSGSHPNLILMRTFSKVYGLAGLRVGYGIGNPEFVARLEKARQPFNLNSIAQAAATAALEDVAHLQLTRDNNKTGLAALQAEFAALQLEFIPSHANFVMVKVGDGARVFQEMQRRGVITRPMAAYNLPQWLRITVGTPAENNRCIGALRTALGR